MTLTCSCSEGQFNPSNIDLISCFRDASASALALRLFCVFDAREHIALIANGALMPKNEAAGMTSLTLNCI
jgi:hypothetical protein